MPCPNEPWSWSVDAREVGDDFTPALGFVNRTGVRDGVIGAQYIKRIDDPWLQWYMRGTRHRATASLSNDLQSYSGVVYVGAQNNAGDRLFRPHYGSQTIQVSVRIGHTFRY